MSLDGIRWLFRAWRYRYRLERREIALLLQQLRPGDWVVDVGAHKGAYTYWMRRAVGATGRVFAFEPQPVLAARLQALVTGAGLANVRVENAGVSSSSGSLMLSVPGGGPSPGATFERAPHAAADCRTYAVAVTTLDEYFAGQDASRVRLIKCDAEGHELEVFRGAERLLAAARPRLLFECERRHRASGRVDDVFAYLQGLGYRGAFIHPGGVEDIGRFDPEVHQASNERPGYVNNFLFTMDP